MSVSVEVRGVSVSEEGGGVSVVGVSGVSAALSRG